MLRRLNPFRTLHNPREVWAWGMYDLANQSFQLLINTLLFALYLQKVVCDDADAGKRAWGMMVTGAMLLVVIASPLLGALADQRAWKREVLLTTGFLCVALTAALVFVGPGMLWLAVLLYVPAAFCCGIGENFLGSFLPEIATPGTMGRVSAIGWTMSYIGALLLLGACAGAIFGFGLDAPAEWRWLFLFAALWFLVGMMPTVLFVRERATARPAGIERTLAGATFRRLGQTLREARRYRQFLRFLGVFFIYSLGTQTVIYFAADIGDKLGFQMKQLVLMALDMAATAGVGAVVSGIFQDRIGHKRMVLVFLAVWTVATLALAVMQRSGGGVGAFWVIAGMLGFALGGIGTSSRALVGVFTPQEKAAEFFGLWGMVYKSAILGPLVFSFVSTLVSQSTALFMLAGAFLVGLVLMTRVDDRVRME